MRGRKPKPTVLKLLDGNPGKRPLNDREPASIPGIPDMPEDLDDEAQAEWNRIVPELREMGLLCRADRAALTGYCTSWSRCGKAEARVGKGGTTARRPGKKLP